MASTADNSENLLFVFTDIETDSFRADFILQIGAVTQDNLIFETYINPESPLPLSITNFLGLYFYRGELYKNGKKLASTNVKTALTRFMKWIRDLNRPVMLVFHNGFNFDCSVLTRHLIDLEIPIPDNLVKMGDTLPFFRNTLKPPMIENHKLSTLASFYNINNIYQHDALADSQTLKQICEHYIENSGHTLSDIFKDSTRNVTDYVNKHVSNIPLPKLKKPKKSKPLNK